jgi:hypothetical protein
MAGEESDLKIDMKVKYKGGTERTVEISLSNEGDRKISLLRCDLPWRHTNSMTLVLMRSHAGRQRVEEPPMIDDLVAGAVTLKPKEVLTGQVELIGRFPDIEEVLSKTGIDVFWAYELVSIENKKSRRLGGWFYIPRSGSSK